MRPRRARRLALLVAAATLAGAAASCASSGAPTPVPWTGYPLLTQLGQDRTFLVLFCKYSDISSTPSGLMDEANQLLTDGGVGSGNMVDYWRDVSYGAVSFNAELDRTWIKAPFSTSSESGPNNRVNRVSQCANAAAQGSVDWSRYYGIIDISNADQPDPNNSNNRPGADGGACYTGQEPMKIQGQSYPMSCVVYDQWSLFLAFAAHEIGHALGFPHSYNNNPQWGAVCNTGGGQYGDPWDLMSAECDYEFKGANQYAGYPDNAGPGLNAPNLIAMGWIPYATYTAGKNALTTTITLAALSHPRAASDLAAKIVLPGQAAGDFYTVEYRQKDGWDAGIPENTVLIHQVENVGTPPFVNPAPWSYLQTTDGQPVNVSNLCSTQCELDAKMSWTDPTGTVQVTVESIDPGNGTATIQIGPPNGSPLIGGTPTVSILAPAANSSIEAGVPFDLVARADSAGGEPLPDSDLQWTLCSGGAQCPAAGGQILGTGATLLTSLTGAGPVTVAVTATDPGTGETASASVVLNVVAPTPTATPTATASGQVTPAPTLPPPPTVTILSPAAGTDIPAYEYQNFSIVLSSQASSGVVSYQWSDSLHLFTDSRADDTVSVPQSQFGCVSKTDTIYLKVTDGHGQTASATPVTISITGECTQ